MFTYCFFEIHKSLPPGIELVSADDMESWLLDIKVLDANPLYMNETYRLKFKFSPSYPIGMYLSSKSPNAYNITSLHCSIYYETTLDPPPHLETNPNYPRTTRSYIRKCKRPPDSHAPTHLLQRNHLSGPPRLARLDTHTKRGKHMHESPKHVDGKHQERETRR